MMAGIGTHPMILCPAQEAFEVNSIPLSETIILGLPRASMSAVSSRATRLPEIEVLGIAADIRALHHPRC